MKKNIATFSLVLALTLLLTICASCRSKGENGQPPLASGSVIVADDTIPDRAPNITGVVTAVSRVREGVTVLVEIPGKNNAYTDGTVYVTVTGRTVVETGDKKQSLTLNDIQPGDTVSVWYAGGSTGTTPEYATAQGVRVTSRVEDLLLTVRLGNTAVMASPAEGEVTRTDVKPLLYGSYLIHSGEGLLQFGFSKQVSGLTATVLPLKSNDGSYHIKTDPATMTGEIPANVPAGEYLVSVKVDHTDGADYYMFLLNVQ